MSSPVSSREDALLALVADLLQIVAAEHRATLSAALSGGLTAAAITAGGPSAYVRLLDTLTRCVLSSASAKAAAKEAIPAVTWAVVDLLKSHCTAMAEDTAAALPTGGAAVLSPLSSAGAPSALDSGADGADGEKPAHDGSTVTAALEAAIAVCPLGAILPVLTHALVAMSATDDSLLRNIGAATLPAAVLPPASASPSPSGSGSGSGEQWTLVRLLASVSRLWDFLVEAGVSGTEMVSTMVTCDDTSIVESMHQYENNEHVFQVYILCSVMLSCLKCV